MSLHEVDKEMTAQVVRIWELEKSLAARQNELHNAVKLIAWQNTELNRANEEIEKQKAELRVVDEETVKQLEKIQKTFAVFEEREHSFEKDKILSKKIISSLKEKVSVEIKKFAESEKQLVVEQNTNIAFQVQVADLKNKLAECYSLKEQSRKVKKDLEIKNRQLFDENEQLREESRITMNKLKKAAVELQSAVMKQDSEFKQIEEQCVIIERQNTELQILRSRLSLLNITKTSKSTQTTELINHQHKSGFDTRWTTSELCSPNKCSCAKSNERNASRFLWLLKKCAQLKDLLEKFELEHCILAEKTSEENKKMKNDLDRLSKEGLRKDKELDRMESSLEELGKVKNCEISGLKQVLRRLESKYLAVKKELSEKDDKSKIFTRIRNRGKSLGQRQQ